MAVRAVSLHPVAFRGSCAGFTTVSLTGVHFGPSSAVQVVSYGSGAVGDAVYSATCGTVSVNGLNQDTLQCVASPGVGTGLHWTIVVEGQSSTPSVATTAYRSPTVSAITGNTTRRDADNGFEDGLWCGVLTC